MSQEQLNSFESQMVQYFSEAVKIFGLPKSVGEIYGLLYSSPVMLSMDDLVDKLRMSKGSCSQGLKILRTVNAVVENIDGRKTLYSANIELKSLISGILNEQVQPLFSTTKSTVKELMVAVQSEPDADKNHSMKAESPSSLLGAAVEVL